MIKFIVTSTEALLRYEPDFGSQDWVQRELDEHGSITLSRVFHFRKQDHVPSMEGEEEFEIDKFAYDFKFATRSDGYFHIDGRILDIPNNVLIADTGLPLTRKLFAAERNISIFGRIAALLPPDQEIAIGGARSDSIPISAFEELLRKFPNTTELNRYADARVASVVGDYFESMRNAEAKYESYLNKTRSMLKGAPLRQPDLLRVELEKYVLIRDTISDWLRNELTRSESDWQKMIVTFLLLIFPKYVAVLENVQVRDFYSTADKARSRYIDLALVDSGGNIDVIEVKKPFENALLSRRKYRDNYVPAKELAGSIMQAEKYLFHLSKWGVAGEKQLTTRYQEHLPKGMAVRITNPKAMIIVGRDRDKKGAETLDASQGLDLEIIKRKYANMIDIMTYDDLLRRLDNIIDSLRQRVEKQIRPSDEVPSA